MIRLIPVDISPAFPEKEEAVPYCCTPAWAGLCRDVFGYEVKTFSIEQDSGRIGGFMYAVVRSPIFGTRLVSMPFSDEGALWFKPGAIPDADGLTTVRDAVTEVLDKAARETGADYAELRGTEILFPAGEKDERFIRALPYTRFVLDTSAPYAALRERFHINLVKNLRKADKHVTVTDTRDPAEVKAVYDIYARQMREFGSPPLPAEYFGRLMREGLGRLFIARVNGRAAAMLFTLEHNGARFADINAGLPEFEEFFPKIRLFDETIRSACGGNFSAYDLMRTRPGSGVHEHKKKWGGKEFPIRYYFRQYKPGANISMDPEQKRFAPARFLLAHMPLPLLKKLGPIIRRHAGK
ncbi:MAG: GNAT family N-acetyltransferase [Elusimicrobia bacterium]|nr:GNAT family N-acetyltransferase [Elusimicrobiota bacterium]